MSHSRQGLKQGGAPHIAIVSSYNDLLSAHAPLRDYPERLKTALAKVGATAQFAAGVPAMCDGITQGEGGMQLSLFSRDLIAQATAIGMTHAIFDGGMLGFLSVYGVRSGMTVETAALLLTALSFGRGDKSLFFGAGDTVWEWDLGANRRQAVYRFIPGIRQIETFNLSRAFGFGLDIRVATSDRSDSIWMGENGEIEAKGTGTGFSGGSLRVESPLGDRYARVDRVGFARQNQTTIVIDENGKPLADLQNKLMQQYSHRPRSTRTGSRR